MTQTLVTGGAGFIGSYLVDLLVQRQSRVRVLALPGSSVAHLPLSQIEIIFGDIRDRAIVRQAVQGCTEVYHLAADPQL